MVKLKILVHLSLEQETPQMRYHYPLIQIQTFIVVKSISGVTQATVAPWAGSSGGGLQYDLPYSIPYLEKNGYLIKVR